MILRLKQNLLKFIITVSIGILVSAGTETLLAEKASSKAQQKAIAAFRNNAIVKAKGCVACHSVSGSGGTVGPTLDQVGNRRTAKWLRTWLKDPKAIKPNTKMLTFGFSDQELDELVAVVKQLRREIDSQAILNSSAPLVEKGAQLFAAYDCYACHRIGTKGQMIGPQLTWLGKRKNVAWEKKWLKNPQAIQPGTFMPTFPLQDAEIEALAAFVVSQTGQKNAEAKTWEENLAFTLDSRPREIGEKVYRRFGCDGCHGQYGKGGFHNPNAAPDQTSPAIATVTQSKDKAAILAIIMNGSVPAKLDPAGPEPLSCPSWKEAMSQEEAGYVYEYLLSLAPKN